MAYLIAVTILWAFSFSLIDVYLAGQVDSDFAVLSRVLLAALIFLPLARLRGLPPRFCLAIVATGALQFGFTYLFLYRAFAYLTVPEILLFTVTTPIYVVLADDALGRRFAPVALVSALLAIIGAGLIRYDGITESFLIGFVLIQVANLCFALGQVGYKHAVARTSPNRPGHRYFLLFFLGGVLVSGPSFLIFGDMTALPSASEHWLVLAWLGLAASGAGLYFWNRGACLVDGGTLAVMNNVLIPAGLLVNILIWNRDADLMRLALGGAVILGSLWFNRHFSRYAVINWRGRESGAGST